MKLWILKLQVVAVAFTLLCLGAYVGSKYLAPPCPTPRTLSRWETMPEGLTTTPDGRLVIRAGKFSPWPPTKDESYVWWNLETDYAWEPKP